VTILEQLEAIEPGLRRHYFLKDHAEEIRRAVALGEWPATTPWDPRERWSWLRWGERPGAPGAASAHKVLTDFSALPFAERAQIYRRNKDVILQELENFERR
jgi:hypothetical protein